MKHIKHLMNLPAILLLIYLVLVSFKQAEIADGIIVATLSAAFCFFLHISFLRDKERTESDPAIDKIRLDIEKFKLDYQLIMAKKDIEKANKVATEGDLYDQSGKIRF